jgi:hypothetical protein
MPAEEANALALQVAGELARGSRTCEEVSRELRRMSAVSPKFSELVHFLYHYVTDEDIRARDPEYAAWQLAHLHELIAEASSA